jgi:hypothetical protein
MLHRNSRVRWARNWALPEIERLANRVKYNDAFDLALQAQQELGSDPELARIWPEISRRVNIEGSQCSQRFLSFQVPQAGLRDFVRACPG